MNVPAIQSYISSVIGSETSLSKFDESTLPLYLRARYTISELTLLGSRCLLAKVCDIRAVSPKILDEDRQMIARSSGLPLIYWLDRIEPYQRLRFIERRLSFIVWNRQMFLPFLGIDLQENYRRSVEKSYGELFTPSAQAVALALIQCPRLYENQPVPLSLVAQHTGYAKNTVGNAFSHLESTGEFTAEERGRERTLRFERPSLGMWNRLKDRFSSPVKERRWVRREDNLKLIEAGVTALSGRSQIAPSRTPVYATDSLKSQEAYLSEAFPTDPDAMQIEVWRYDPLAVLGRLGRSGQVDNLSLYLAMQDDPEERVQGALEELLEQTFA